MAKTISALPAAAQANDIDELEANQSGTSRKVTRAQLVTGLATDSHGHALADITDAGALAARDSVGSPEIDTGAVSAAKIADGAVTPAKLDRDYAEFGHTHEAATSGNDGYMSAADKAKLDGIEAGAEANRALASQAEAEAGTDNAKGMTPLRTAEAISALAGSHNHTLAEITDAGALAGLDLAATDDIADGAITPEKLAHVEDIVAGVHTLAATDRLRIKVYTGGGDTWTVPNIGVGRVDIVNDGTGDITLSPSGIALSGTATIPAGRTAVLIGYAGGTKVKNVVEGSWI